jgi:hypothetical protein
MKKSQVVIAAIIVLCASFGLALANPGQPNSEAHVNPDTTNQQKKAGNQGTSELASQADVKGLHAARKVELIRKSKEQSERRREVILARQEEQKKRAVDAIAGVKRAKAEHVKSIAGKSSKSIEIKAKEIEQEKKKKSDGNGDKK